MEVNDREEYSLDLDCSLTEEQVAEKSKQLATAFSKYSALDEERKQVMGQFRRSISGLLSEMSTLSEVCRTGRETQSVKCVHVWDRSERRRIDVRLDTGAVIGIKAMSDDEQMLLKTETALKLSKEVAKQIKIFEAQLAADEKVALFDLEDYVEQEQADHLRGLGFGGVKQLLGLSQDELTEHTQSEECAIDLIERLWHDFPELAENADDPDMWSP